ncbi:glycosyltransferase family 4 protein [Bizionia sp.]|uniref:glycosyltransferase family 4 protein n=1 Tax=Bizionia sp. TaxID=1954480 RepID=UPI003A8DEE92
MNKNNILISAPELNELGGVANHYKGLSKYFSHNVRFHVVGRRKNRSGAFYLPFDIISFIFKMMFFNIDTVLLNPSLATNAMKRDEVFLKIAKFFNKKVVVFIHGWDKEYEIVVQKKPKQVLGSFYRADAFLVLASEFKDKLSEWGIGCPIHLTTTKVDDSLLDDFHLEKRSFKEINFLFLARIVKNKGIFEALDAIKEINNRGEKINLSVVGDGPALEEARQYALDNRLSNVHFKGRLDGDELAAQFIVNNIYLFPSYHGEGMPTSVLEAMAFGMPIVTTANAGLKDIFENKKMGVFCKMRDTDALIESTLSLIKSDALAQISHYNYDFAKENFMASKVASNLESLVVNIK